MGDKLGTIITERFDDAAEFLAALRPMGRWLPDPESWVFRGHADASWKLLPSANRRKTLAKFVAELSGDEIYCEPTLGQVRDLLQDFHSALDRAGFEAPAPEPSVQVGFKPDEPALDQLTALGQHHGLPTVMLDWTRYGIYAAYFAASDTAGIDPSGNLEVWALNKKTIEAASASSKTGYNGQRYVTVRIVVPQRAGNANLHAQGGLFTVAMTEVDVSIRTSLFDLTPLDEAVRMVAEANQITEPTMYRLSLPRREAGALLRRLSYEPVTGATTFPDLDGVVRDVRDRTRWPRRA